MTVEAEGPHKALVDLFGPERVDSFPPLLMESMTELFERGRRLGVSEEKIREEIEGEAKRDDAWKDAYDLGWEDAMVEHRPEQERLLDLAHKKGYDAAIKELSPYIHGTQKKEKTA